MLDPGVIGQRTKRLLLQGRDAGIQLIAAGRVRSSRPRIGAVGSRERDIVDAWNRAPHVDECLRRRRVGRGIDQADERRQREGDSDEAILTKVAEVARVLAVGPEIIGIDRSKRRVIGVRIPAPPPLEQLEPRLDAGRRELEMVRGHMAVGTRATVGVQPVQTPIEKCEGTAHDGAARLPAAERLPV
jgi:hypothetical protein